MGEGGREMWRCILGREGGSEVRREGVREGGREGVREMWEREGGRCGGVY